MREGGVYRVPENETCPLLSSPRERSHGVLVHPKGFNLQVRNQALFRASGGSGEGGGGDAEEGLLGEE